MRLTLETPTLADCLAVLPWRAAVPETLRTTRGLTEDEQRAFYRDVVCNPASPHRYYAVRVPCDEAMSGCRGEFVGLVSLEHISWENGSAEIGLLIDPARRGQGIGREAVRLVLDKAFRELRLLTVWGEVYRVLGHAEFWMHVVDEHGGETTTWARRKFWNGTLHNALLFTIPRPGEAAQEEDTRG